LGQEKVAWIIRIKESTKRARISAAI